MKPLAFLPFLIIHGVLAAALLVAGTNVMVHHRSEARIYDSVEEVPANQTALLLGTPQYVTSGRPNPFFQNRIRAAVELYEGGKVRFIIASGDNRHRSYNEPLQMQEALLEAGVPERAVVPDFAGFRTLDSVIRAERVFGQSALTIVSQRFHSRRALYIARRHGMDAIAYAAPDVRGSTGLRLHLRELLARTLAVIDVELLDTQPRFLGDPVAVP